MITVWSELHQDYKNRDWIIKPSVFAESAIQYFPAKGKVLELGAGLAQDSYFFAEQGYSVVATDIEITELTKPSGKLHKQIFFEKVDLRDELPYSVDSFDIVYAHLSLHYFDHETTVRLLGEIQRVLKPGGTFAFLVNSINDPEYGTGKEIEKDLFQINKKTKRYFSVESVRELTQYFEVNLLDDLGETYKDSVKGVHNLIRFVGKKTKNPQLYKGAIPYVGAIVERDNKGLKEVLLQIRWKPQADPLYSGTLEFPAGVLDKPYENVFEAVAREIKEETGLILKTINGESKTNVFSPNGEDKIFAFKPFCCTQQLASGKPWIGFVFICEVQDGEPKSQLSEAKDVKWVSVEDVKELLKNSPAKFFGLELPAWEYYFEHNVRKQNDSRLNA